jgi:hypothetical protein
MMNLTASAAPEAASNRFADLTVDVGRDYSVTPGGRYKRYGPFSGEEFRSELLAPRLRKAIEKGVKLRVRIDSVQRSYQSSFLDEAFGGLIRDEGFSRDDLAAHLIILSEVPRFAKYRALAQRYIEEA